jgi:dolichol-phosphate mannosyltransferase
MSKEYDNPSISIVVPVFNNQESLQILVNQVGITLRDYSEKNKVEIIFVDDGSTDSSVEAIRTLAIPSNLKVVLAKHGTNHGQLRAIYSGFSLANSEVILHMTADLQDPPELILDFIEEYKNGFEIVYGIRKVREDGAWRRVTSSLAYKIARVGNPLIPREGFDYFLISADVKNELIKDHNQREFIQGAILKTRSNHKGIPYTRRKREYGKSQWTFSKMARLLVDILVESTFAPIRILTSVGLIIVAITSALLLYFVILKFLGYDSFDGFTALAFLIVALGGMNLLIVGILAEYLIRLIKQISRQDSIRPVSIETIKHS